MNIRPLVIFVFLTLFVLSATAQEEQAPAAGVKFTPTGFEIGGGKAAWGDFDGDGYADLIAAGQVWRNESGKSFKAVASSGGDAIWGDFDNDGRLDFFAYSVRRLYRNVGENRFEDVSSLLPEMPMQTTRGAAWGDFNGDSFLDLYVGAYEKPGYQPDVLLLSEKGERFVIAWQQAGDVDPSRGITAADFDEDGDLDVYVSNYRLEQNQLWCNDGQGNLENVGPACGVQGTDDGWAYSYGHTIGSAWGDFDSDGHIDLFVGNFSHPPAWQDRPRFYRNLGPDKDFHFEDKSGQAGLKWQESFASPAFGDFDNDGLLDLYFTTVYGGDHNVVYRNMGDCKFQDVTAQVGIPETTTYQAAWCDFDNDGDLDLATNGTIYRNSGTPGTDHSWLRVKLVGDGKTVNRSAIGAVVRVKVGERTITRQVESGTGEGNQNDLTLHFGLGKVEGKVPVEIRWPGGAKEVFDTEPNKTLVKEFTVASNPEGPQSRSD